MNKRKLGRTDLQVSALGCCTAQLARINDEAAALALLDSYRAQGGNFIQSVGFCPRSAGAQPPVIYAEEIVGRWQQSRGIPRDSLLLATRLNLFRPAHGGSISFANLIRESCEKSLRRLQVKHLDLLVCEWDAQLIPVEDTIEAFDRLIRAGLIRHVVAGGFPPWRVVDSLHRSALRNHCRFEALQTEYSLITRARFEGEALAMCKEHRLGFIARSPLAGGFLAKQPLSIRELINTDVHWPGQRFGNSYGDTMLTALAKIAETRAATSAQIALAWVLQNPRVSAALVSPTSASDLADMIQATELRLTDDECATLNAMTPTQDFRPELRPA